MGLGKKVCRAGACGMLAASALTLHAQDARQIVRQAVTAELAANRDDQSHWRYRKSEDGGNEWVVVETEKGALERHLKEDGKPASQSTLNADDEHIREFLRDPGMRQKQVKDAAHDEKDATELMNLLSEAFTWKVESETPESFTLHFKPDPNFHPPDMEARVMGEMEGTLIVNKSQHRIETMKGVLTEDINIGFGLLAKLRQGGTFNIERRQIAPGHWENTETHVHIDGRALFFKTIGQQQDEVKSDFSRVPPGTTLEQGAEMLKQPLK